MLHLSVTPDRPLAAVQRVNGTTAPAVPDSVGRWNAALTRVGATRRNDHGGALLEPLIAVALVGAIASLSLSGLSSTIGRVETVACKMDKKTVDNAAQAYYANSGMYATNMDMLITGGFLRTAPLTTHGYTITYDGRGTVSVAPGGACS